MKKDYKGSTGLMIEKHINKILIHNINLVFI